MDDGWAVEEWMGGRLGGILVGTDGSATATKAVEAAARMAEAYETALTVAMGLRQQPSRHAGELRSLPDDQRWQVSPGMVGEEILRRAVQSARAAVATDLRVGARFELGEPARVLLDLIDDLDIGAVVVGNVGLDGWGHHWSVPHKVARRAHCPVVIVDTVEWSRRGEDVTEPTHLTLRRCA